jgi:Rieske Fe-S protein
MDEINYRQINQRNDGFSIYYCTHMGCTYIQMQIKAFLLFPSYYYILLLQSLGIPGIHFS